jgi:hypothetical protein
MRRRGFPCRMHLHPPLCVSGEIESKLNDDETRIDKVGESCRVMLHRHHVLISD